LMTVMGLYGARYLASLLSLPKGVIAAYVAFFSIFGAYAVNSNLFDVWVMFASAIFAVAIGLVGIPILPVVLAFILGGLLEQNIAIATARAEDISYFLGRPIALGLVAITLVIILTVAWRRMPAVWKPNGRSRNHI